MTYKHISIASYIIFEMSTAKMNFAPASAQNIDKMPVPHPKSITVLPAKSAPLFCIALRYACVRG